MQLTFTTLPVELLYDVHFYAASGALPLTCRRLHDIFKSASPTVHADYLIARYNALRPTPHPPSIITYALRFPICTQPVLSALLKRHPSSPTTATTTTTTTTDVASARGPPPPELPRRLFRRLRAQCDAQDDVLPFLRYLYDAHAKPKLYVRPDVDSHDGYALICAVSVGAVPLVRFLLDHGASPRRRDALSVKLAIKRRDLALVRLLVEAPDVSPDERRKGKRRRLADRVQVDSEMLKTAVRCGAQDVAEYLMNEKGCVPDLKTLSLLSIMEF